MPDDLQTVQTGQNISPNIPPPQVLAPPLAPDVSQGEAPAPSLIPQLPPRPPGTGVAAQPPPNKAEFFRKMLGDFFYSVGKGLSERGTGPQADIRGAGAALTALPERDIMRQQLEIQRQQAQGMAAYHASQAEALKNRYAPQTWIDEQGDPHQISAQDFAKLKATEAKNATTENVAQGKNETAITTTGMKTGSAEDIAGQKIASQEKLSADKLAMMRETLKNTQNYRAASLALRQQGFGLHQQEFAQKQEALSPQAQKVLMDTTPTHDQIQDLMQQFESVKNDNTPASHMVDRAKYAVGIATPSGKAADQIAQLELTRVAGAARVLKGSSRAVQALQLAMKHLPNVWVDSNQLIYSKLANLDGALKQIEDETYNYGKKTGIVPPNRNAPKTGGKGYSPDNPFAKP